MEEFIQSRNSDGVIPFDEIIPLNVLKHVLDPVSDIQDAKMLLDPSGIICLRVPNDFNELQDSFHKKSGLSPWWVAVTDHINYFNFLSLKSLLNKLGLEVIYTQSNFPMELFLLMGGKYVDNSVVGEPCHRKRIDFEVSIPAELRRRIYRVLAEAGIGRDILMLAKTRAD